MNDNHPCMLCKLPECDQASRRCGLRLADRKYKNAKRHGLPISPELRAQYGAAWTELYGARRAARNRERRAKAKKAVEA